MASALYANAKTEFALGNIAWKASGGSTIKAILVDADTYTFSSAHKYLSEVASAARVGSPVQLTLIDATNGGVCDANDIVFSDLESIPTVEAIILYKEGASEAASPLIAYIDTGTGLPTPAGVNSISVEWGNDALKIFKL